MDNLCIDCSALKFNNETLGIYCTGGKMKFQEIHPPLKPISTLVSCGECQSKHFLKIYANTITCRDLKCKGDLSSCRITTTTT